MRKTKHIPLCKYIPEGVSIFPIFIEYVSFLIFYILITAYDLTIPVLPFVRLRIFSLSLNNPQTNKNSIVLIQQVIHPVAKKAVQNDL